MTLQELLADEELRRREFPVAGDKIFLAHAGVCPLPRRVSEAIRHYAANCCLGDQETLIPAFQLGETRELVGRLIGASPEEVAFVGPTSLALSFVASGIHFSPGDNVVAYLDDYPSNVYPWSALAAKGVKVRFLRPRVLGELTLDTVLERVDERTRLVALASCHFIGGYRIDIDGIGAELRRRSVLFCVDAIQTVGAFRTPSGPCDFMAADAHKWMLGPCAAGLLYVRKELHQEFVPGVYGWHNVRSPNFVAQERIEFQPGAARFEAGSHNLLGLVGLKAAAELLIEIGLESIQTELLRKRAWLVPALAGKGFEVLHAQAPEVNAGSIISFFKPGVDSGTLHQSMLDAGVVTSLRQDRAGQEYIRISPHFYNTDAELGRLLELL